MKSMDTLFKMRPLEKPVKKSRRTERGDLFDEFLSVLNPQRKKDGFAPLSHPRLGKILENIPTKDLYYLKRVCEDSKNYSKRFWWELDAKKHEK